MQYSLLAQLIQIYFILVNSHSSMKFKPKKYAESATSRIIQNFAKHILLKGSIVVVSQALFSTPTSFVPPAQCSNLPQSFGAKGLNRGDFDSLIPIVMMQENLQSAERAVSLKVMNTKLHDANTDELILLHSRILTVANSPWKPYQQMKKISSVSLMSFPMTYLTSNDFWTKMLFWFITRRALTVPVVSLLRSKTRHN